MLAQELANNITVAPIGLLDMFNTGGAVEQCDIQMDSGNAELFDGEVASDVPVPLSDNRPASAMVTLRVRGCGRFGFYSSQRPVKCCVDGTKVEFSYNPNNGLVAFSIPVPTEELYRWSVVIQV